MAIGIRELLNLPIWRAYDVDDAGRILAGYDASGSMQLVELAPDGTATPLTALPGACTGKYLAPNQDSEVPAPRAAIVEHDNGGDERKQLSLLPLDPPPADPVGLDGLVPLVRDPRHFHNLLAVLPGRVVYTTNRRNDVDFDVVVREAPGEAETVVYSAGGWIDEAVVASNGRDTVIVRDGTPPMSTQLLLATADSGTAANANADADGDAAGAPRELTDPDEHAQHVRPRWLGESGTLVVTTDREREFTAVLRLDPATVTTSTSTSTGTGTGTDTDAWTELVADPEHDVTGWPSPDGRLLLVMTNVDGEARLSLHDAQTGDRRSDIALPRPGWTGGFPLPEPVWSPNSRFVVLTYSSPSIPGDILRLDVETGELTTAASSTAPLGGAMLAEMVSHRIPTPDGESVPCYVVRDPDASAARKELAGASVVCIHGGPESASIVAFSPVMQALAAAGFTVLVPNVRGSVGYGKRWYSADDVRKRLDSVADLAAIHAWLPSQGLDPNRAALWGGSYGGYMVLAGMAFQPQLWAAGVDIVGMSSLVTFLENTSPYRRRVREREYGYLDQDRDRDFLEAASPLSKVADIRAPLFVIHGANDPRVPLTEAQQLAAAVKDNGVECELLVYPDEGHGLAKRKNRLDAYPQALAFLERHLSAAAKPEPDSE